MIKIFTKLSKICIYCATADISPTNNSIFQQVTDSEVSLDDRKQKHVSFDSSSILRSQTVSWRRIKGQLKNMSAGKGGRRVLIMLTNADKRRQGVFKMLTTDNTGVKVENLDISLNKSMRLMKNFSISWEITKKNLHKNAEIGGVRVSIQKVGRSSTWLNTLSPPPLSSKVNRLYCFFLPSRKLLLTKLTRS